MLWKPKGEPFELKKLRTEIQLVMGFNCAVTCHPSEEVVGEWLVSVDTPYGTIDMPVMEFEICDQPYRLQLAGDVRRACILKGAKI